MIETLLSIFGLGYNYVSGIHQGEKINSLLEQLHKMNQKVEKLSEHIYYCPTFEEVSHSNQRIISELREVRENLQHLQDLTGNNILSSKMITTSDDIQKELRKNPFDVLDYIRPYHRANSHPNPSMIPILFMDGNVQYIGWIMKGLLPNTLGVKYNSDIEKTNKFYTPKNQLYQTSIDYNKSLIPNISSIQTPQNRKDKILNDLRNILFEKFGIKKSLINYDTAIMNDLGLDSLDSTEIIMELEKLYKISIPDDIAGELLTVGEIIQHISSK